MTISAYLAGPDVFYPNPEEIGRLKKELCKKYGILGVYPLDLAPSDLFSGKYNKSQIAKIIKNGCTKGIEDTTILIANLAPFRGISMDAGTAFEMGYADALNRPIYGYTNDRRTYLEKVSEYDICLKTETDIIIDGKGQMVEDFGKIDNCMITESCGNLFYSNPEDQYGLIALETTLQYISSYMRQE